MTTPADIIDAGWANAEIVCGHDVEQVLNAAGYIIVPKEATHEQISAAFGASAPPPDETPILLDCLDFGGENAAVRLVRAVYRAMTAAHKDAA